MNRLLQDTGIFEDYLDKMKKIYTVDVDAIAKVDQFWIGINVFISFAILALFCYWLIRFFAFLAACRSDRASFRDSDFWKRMGIVGLILFLIMSGSMYILFVQLYAVAVEAGWA